MKRDFRMIKFALDMANTMGEKPNPPTMTLDDIATSRKMSEEDKVSFFHTVEILLDRRLIVVDKASEGVGSWKLNRLTWDGHDYFDELNAPSPQAA